MSALGIMGLLAAMDTGYRRGDLTTISILSPPSWDFDHFRGIRAGTAGRRSVRRASPEKRAKRKAQNKARAVTKRAQRRRLSLRDWKQAANSRLSPAMISLRSALRDIIRVQGDVDLRTVAGLAYDEGLRVEIRLEKKASSSLAARSASGSKEGCRDA